MGIKISNNRFFKIFLSQLLGQPLRFIRFSWQVEGSEYDPESEAILNSGQPVIYALWHGRMYCLFKAVPLESVAILVSPSNDGEFITRLARTIGFRNFVRGSHKRGGTQAILGLRKALLEDNHAIAFTVDGPRGPRYKVKPGIIRLASQTGVPIIPLGSASQHILPGLRSTWDHYHAPPPFTRMRLAYGKPLRVPADLTETQIGEYADALEAELRRINLQTDTFYGFRQEERL